MSQGNSFTQDVQGRHTEKKVFEEVRHEDLGMETFQVEETASAKVLRWSTRWLPLASPDSRSTPLYSQSWRADYSGLW